MPARDDIRGKIMTVRGAIEPSALGATLMHEHVLWDITRPHLRGRNDQGPEISLETVWQYNYGEISHPRNYHLEDVAIAIDEVGRMKQAGGQAIVELTCGGLRPDPLGLLAVSEGTGVNIVMGCGHYVEPYQDPRNHDRTVDDLASEMIGQVLTGAWETPVRAGVIGEIGCSAPWTPLERKMMQAALLAKDETGAALNVHPGRHPDQPQEVADFIRGTGRELDRVVISHIDRTIFDSDRLLRLADTGVTIEFDLFGQENSFYALADIDMPNDAQRLRHIRTLIDHGHLDRVVISHDICYLTRLTRFGGHGYGHIFRNVVPMMRRRGFTDDEIDAILVRNPRRLLTFV